MSGAIISEQERRQFHALDLLRGMAAMFVVAHHLSGPLHKIAFGSHLAVDLFFVMSGFVLEHAYAARLRRGLSVRDFMAIRIRRLYPLYILGTVLGLLVPAASMASGAAAPEWRILAASMALAVMFIPAPAALSANHYDVFPFNYPAWSLFWELAINALYAALVGRLGTRLLACVLAVGAVLLIYGDAHYVGLDGGANVTNFALGGLRVVYAFFAGVAVHRVWRGGRYARLRLPPWGAAAILVGMFLLRPWPGVIYDGVVALVAIPLLVLATVQGENGWRPGLCSWMGVLSYPLYALHAPFTMPAIALRTAMVGSSVVGGVAFDLAFIALATCVAAIAEVAFDRPLRDWLRTRGKRPQRQPATMESSSFS